MSGEQLTFNPPRDLGANLDALPRIYGAIRLTGSMRDATGQLQAVAETYENLSEWRDLLHDAHRQWSHPDPEQRLANALASKFKQPMNDLRKGLVDVARAVDRLARTDRDDKTG